MSLLNALRQRSARRRLASDLMQLDDHLLRDIGLSRADLRARVIDPTLPLTLAHARG
jgi:uncharacterized protein YjiS (DUF1127 family)